MKLRLTEAFFIECIKINDQINVNVFLRFRAWKWLNRKVAKNDLPSFLKSDPIAASILMFRPCAARIEQFFRYFHFVLQFHASDTFLCDSDDIFACFDH